MIEAKRRSLSPIIVEMTEWYAITSKGKKLIVEVLKPGYWVTLRFMGKVGGKVQGEGEAHFAGDQVSLRLTGEKFSLTNKSCIGFEVVSVCEIHNPIRYV